MQLELLRMLDGSHIGLAAGYAAASIVVRLPRGGGGDQPRAAGELHVSLPLVLGIGVFGAVGAIARFLLDGAVSARASASFPWGTLVVNLTGAFALGFAGRRGGRGDALRLVGTGLLGALHDVQHVDVREPPARRGRRAARGRRQSARLARPRHRSRSGWARRRRCERRQAHRLLRRARPRRRSLPRRRAVRRLRRAPPRHQPRACAARPASGPSSTCAPTGC